MLELILVLAAAFSAGFFIDMGDDEAEAMAAKDADAKARDDLLAALSGRARL
ncbi:hypothetical protein [Pseudooceanicola sp.]|uniref:hypothetical protein n=1 Tax=Pseudooceanicola sp. TaxID=1914328 RepID=UPI002637B452|nr:hypothetical protein [Pseudooceanicola sp.]MDF1854475.1 hypothetical protein [Pseudooceanicola sp.]